MAMFSLGYVIATCGALEGFARTGEDVEDYLYRHATGDWGDVPFQDAKENERSVKEGFRILSSYRLMDNTRIWVITEADRSVTTFLLPEEY